MCWVTTSFNSPFRIACATSDLRESCAEGRNHLPQDEFERDTRYREPQVAGGRPSRRAQQAKENCLVSRLLNIEVALEARLLSESGAPARPSYTL
jgi:hypothetical protein